MKEAYEVAEMEIIEFETEDVITSSGGGQIGGVNRRFFQITEKLFKLFSTVTGIYKWLSLSTSTEEIDCEDKKYDFNSSMYLLPLPVWKCTGVCGRILWKFSIRR